MRGGGRVGGGWVTKCDNCRVARNFGNVFLFLAFFLPFCYCKVIRFNGTFTNLERCERADSPSLSLSFSLSFSLSLSPLLLLVCVVCARYVVSAFWLRQLLSCGLSVYLIIYFISFRFI